MNTKQNEWEEEMPSAALEMYIPNPSPIPLEGTPQTVREYIRSLLEKQREEIENPHLGWEGRAFEAGRTAERQAIAELLAKEFHPATEAGIRIRSLLTPKPEKQ